MRDSVTRTARGVASLMTAALPVALFASPVSGQATDLYLEGTGARAIALGGATTASPRSPLAAFAYNPAGLGGVDGWTVAGSMTGSRVSGDYTNQVSSGNGIGRQFGAIGSLALAYTSGDIAFGFGAQPVNAYLADWNYPDVPGVAGARYDNVEQSAFFLNYRFGLGAAYQVSDRLAVGVSGGLVYNRNELDAPYVFQSQPVLAGLKVDVDLVTETFAPNFNLGVLYQAWDEMTVGLSYTAGTALRSDGALEGSAAAQFAALGLNDAPPELRYDAEVETGLPQMVSLGMAYEASDRLALFGQVDWVDWSQEFGSLVLRLENGTNPAVNGLVGGDGLTEESPLNWESRLVSRLGMSYELSADLTGRLGYSQADSPVPDANFTPLSGLITEKTLSGGLGWTGGRWDAGLAFQFELPAERSISTSGLLSGEYSNTRTRVSIQRVTLTFGTTF